MARTAHMQHPTASALVALASIAALTGCPTRMPDDGATGDATYTVVELDPRVPNVGEGTNAPPCAPEEIIDINTRAFHTGNEYRIRVDTRNRRNLLHPDCSDRDSSEAVLRYTVPAFGTDTPRVRAIRVSTVATATNFDTVLSVRNDCGPEYHDYSCNNDGFLDDGRETRRSAVYFVNLDPEQYVFVVVDGFDGSSGLAEIILNEILESDMGTLNNPCIPVPPSEAMNPDAPTAGYRCPNPNVRCHPGAASDGTDLCLPLMPLGSPCDPEERRNVCEPFRDRQVLCAQNPESRTEALCALPGTAAGALCRRDAPRCDGRLACSPTAGFESRDICVPLRGNMASCSPAAIGYTSRCEDGLRCCGDIADAGATYVCRPPDFNPCFQEMTGP